MALTQIATRIDSSVKRALEEVCEDRGLKINRFVEEAILDKLEELEDLQDLRKLRREKFRSLDVVVSDLRKNGKL